MDLWNIVLIYGSPIVLLISFPILIYRLIHRKQANIIKGEIVDNVYTPMNRTAAARVKILEGVNKGNHFVSKSTRSLFGHSIGKEVKLYEFEDGGDFDYYVASSYLFSPFAFTILFTFIFVIYLLDWLS